MFFCRYPIVSVFFYQPILPHSQIFLEAKASPGLDSYRQRQAFPMAGPGVGPSRTETWASTGVHHGVLLTFLGLLNVSICFNVLASFSVDHYISLYIIIYYYILLYILYYYISLLCHYCGYCGYHMFTMMLFFIAARRCRCFPNGGAGGDRASQDVSNGWGDQCPEDAEGPPGVGCGEDPTDLPIKNGDFPSKNGDLPLKMAIDGWFTS